MPCRCEAWPHRVQPLDTSSQPLDPDGAKARKLRQRGTRSEHSPLAKVLLRKADLESVAAENSTSVDPSLLREIDRLEHSIVDYLRECGHGSMLESALHEARVEAEVSERNLLSKAVRYNTYKEKGG